MTPTWLPLYSSKEPVVKIGDFKAGAHINALGLPGQDIAKSHCRSSWPKIYLDWYENCSWKRTKFLASERGTLSNPISWRPR